MAKGIWLMVALVAMQVSPPGFRARTDLVAMTVTVLDGNGIPVPGLGQDAFRVTEDGRDQPIAHFAAGGTPISIVVALGSDQLRTEPPGTPATRMAARQRAIPAIERVRHSEAMVYAIGIDAPDAPPAYRLDAGTLRELTEPTGGSTQIAHSNGDVIKAASQIGDELRLQYVIGFAPANPGDGKFHKVQVSVNNCPKCRVRARAGYIGER